MENFLKEIMTYCKPKHTFCIFQNSHEFKSKRDDDGVYFFPIFNVVLLP